MAGLLNGLIFAQIFYYGSGTVKAAAPKKGVDKKAKKSN